MWYSNITINGWMNVRVFYDTIDIIDTIEIADINYSKHVVWKKYFFRDISEIFWMFQKPIFKLSF